MAKEYFGFNPPFFGGQQNIMSRQSGDRLIKNDLLQLILTTPGERVMRPNWGTNVRTALFQNIDDRLIADLKNSISTAISTYEPRVDVDVDIASNPDSNQLNIFVSGIFTNRPNDTFEMDVNLPFQTATES